MLCLLDQALRKEYAIVPLSSYMHQGVAPLERYDYAPLHDGGASGEEAEKHALPAHGTVIARSVSTPRHRHHGRSRGTAKEFVV